MPTLKPERSTNYQDVAAIGFALGSGVQDTALTSAFNEGADQLAGRKYFAPGRAPRFEIDSYAMLGIAIGYWATNASAADKEWIIDCLNQSYDHLKQDLWQYSLARSAHAVMDSAKDLEGIDPTIRVGVKAATGISTTEEERVSAWGATIENIGDQDGAKIAIYQRVYDVCAAALVRMPIHGAGLNELIELLVGVSESMSHWTYEVTRRVRGVTPQKWEIDHEYHVQNLLWTILRPVFPDLVDEETLQKMGHTSPRYDIGIPSLHTIVEVKYMRRRGQSELKKITDEIAADRSLYLREGSGYSTLVVFIWDEARQTEEYKTLQDGLESLTGIEKVIILPRPSKMER
ncbi:MAG: hypothetical protein VX599_00770 [Pseudomonadota bacterium]|nr:hypothetical protein [Pseudomonadota bacterium]